MKDFSSGFLFTSGCITALIFLWLVLQVFVRLKVQEIHYRGQSRVLHVHLPLKWEEQALCSLFYLSNVSRTHQAHREKLYTVGPIAMHEDTV